MCCCACVCVCAGEGERKKEIVSLIVCVGGLCLCTLDSVLVCDSVSVCETESVHVCVHVLCFSHKFV